MARTVKNIVSLTCVWIACIVLMVHAIVPHHHHQDTTICLSTTSHSHICDTDNHQLCFEDGDCGKGSRSCSLVLPYVIHTGEDMVHTDMSLALFLFDQPSEDFVEPLFVQPSVAIKDAPEIGSNSLRAPPSLEA